MYGWGNLEPGQRTAQKSPQRRGLFNNHNFLKTIKERSLVL